jgi:hypothetical protein
LELDRVPEAEDIDLSSSVVEGRTSWVLLYIDRNDDANPELVTLNYTKKIVLDIDGDGRPEGHMSFHWMGICTDWNSDGTWDAQGFRTGYILVIDLNNDRALEIKVQRNAGYMRFRRPLSPTWNRIEAHACQVMVLDLDSDTAPELVQRSSVGAVWINRDGDRWPEDIRYSRNEHHAKDKDSDGNPEIKEKASLNFNFVDRDDDMYPELVRIEYMRTTCIDRDSDGRIDQVRFLRKLLLWIDRNSDGIPERVVRSSFEEMRAPSATDDVEPCPERKRAERNEDGDLEGPRTGSGDGPPDRPEEGESEDPESDDRPKDIRDEKEGKSPGPENDPDPNVRDLSPDDTARIDRQKI